MNLILKEKKYKRVDHQEFEIEVNNVLKSIPVKYDGLLKFAKGLAWGNIDYYAHQYYLNGYFSALLDQKLIFEYEIDVLRAKIIICRDIWSRYLEDEEAHYYVFGWI